MNSYNFSPIEIDDDDYCIDCGKFIESGSGGICEYCNERFKGETRLEDLEREWEDEHPQLYIEAPDY